MCRSRRLRVLHLLLAGSTLVLPSSAVAATEQLIVGFSASSAPVAQTAELRAAGVTKSASGPSGAVIPQLDAATIDVPAGQVAAVRRVLMESGTVDYVEVDHVAHAYDIDGSVAVAAPSPTSEAAPVAEPTVPNDTFFTSQWGFEKLGVLDSWSYTRGSGVIIAVVDTGVDSSHPDLRGQVLAGRDFVDGDGQPGDTQGHGTHVAGVVAALTGDQYGISGIAPEARILPVRVLDDEGSGNYSDVARGVVYAVDHGARVINLSLGGDEDSQLLHEAVDYASARGAIVTCATGNAGRSTVGYPAGYASCVSVGASDQADRRASFSNTGRGIDLMAPGVDIMSSVPGASHDSWDGTSMASPSVAGVAGLLLAQGASRSEAVAAMTSTALDMAAPGVDRETGAGRIDAAAAVERIARSPRARADVSAPSVTSVVGAAGRVRIVTTWTMAWKQTASTAWRKVGVTQYRGTYSWDETSTKGVVRTRSWFRMAGGSVYRRTVTERSVRTAKRTRTSMLVVRVGGRDDVGVDRVALRVGRRVVGVDWNGADGWVFRVPCTGGTVSLAALAWDAADNVSSIRTGSTTRC